MKKEYKDLELEVVEFTADDVITASAPGCDPDKCRKIMCEAIGPDCEALTCGSDGDLCKCTGPYAYEAP